MVYPKASCSTYVSSAEDASCRQEVFSGHTQLMLFKYRNSRRWDGVQGLHVILGGFWTRPEQCCH